VKHIAVIGAGIAGIAVAIRLQHAGFDVTIYERNTYPGGKLSEINFNGYRFDAGPSLFTMPHFVEELFSLTGSNTSEYFKYIKKDIVCEYFFADETRFTAYADLEQYKKEAIQKFDVDSQKLNRYFQQSRLKYDLTSPLFLEKSLHKLSTYISKDTIKAIASIHKLTLFDTLHDVNESFFDNPKLVQLFDRYATYNGSSPYLTPGIMSLIPHLEQYYGTFLPKGGMISITKSLVKLAENIGVKFEYGVNVDSISVELKKANGVVVDGQFKTADIVVSNMDIVPTYRKLLKEQPQPEKVLQQERSSSALIFYWGIQHVFPELNLHNIFFADNYQAEFKAIFETKNVVDDITVYVHISSKDEPSDAPAGCENWFVMVNVPSNTGQDWDEIIQRTRTNIINRISSKLKVNLSELISCESILDPRSIEFKTQSYQGALYGAASNDRYAAFLRHPNFSRTIDNIYFCGGSVHPGGGIPLCLLSAKITSDLIGKP
jgi:phytoene desaturase